MNKIYCHGENKTGTVCSETWCTVRKPTISNGEDKLNSSQIRLPFGDVG